MGNFSTGKGYLAIVIIAIVFAGFGIAFPVHNHLIRAVPVYWGCAGLISGVAIWSLGRRLNVRARAFAKSGQIPRKLVYRARHRLFSLPMEYWTALPIAGGLIAIVEGLGAAR